MILKNNTKPIILGNGITNLKGRFVINSDSPLFESFLTGNRSDEEVTININEHSEKSNLEIINGNININGLNRREVMLLFANLLSLRESQTICPNMTIIDVPKCDYREFMLDIARNYISLNEIERIIDEMFRNRINYLHLHISDDQNYGIESRVHPELNTKEFLTIAEIKELIYYAKIRGIEVIPEFDVPGHLNHLLEINPSLRCNKAKGNSLCFAKNHSYIYELIDEICDIFESSYFHIGGDEVGFKNQCNCPECKALMARKGYNGPEELAVDFINEVATYLGNNGKTVIAWNDCLKYGHINDEVIIEKWFNYAFDKTCLEEARRGRRMIISSATDNYFNDTYSLTPLRKTYNYIPEVNGSIVLSPYGVAAPLWTEIITEEEIEKFLFPRLQAFGENAWLDYQNLNYRDFLIRARIELKALEQRGIDFTSLDKVDGFDLKEVIAFLRKKLAFKNYTDFRTIDLLKMMSEYRFDRKYPVLTKKK